MALLSIKLRRNCAGDKILSNCASDKLLRECPPNFCISSPNYLYLEQSTAPTFIGIDCGEAYLPFAPCETWDRWKVTVRDLTLATNFTLFQINPGKWAAGVGSVWVDVYDQYAEAGCDTIYDSLEVPLVFTLCCSESGLLAVYTLGGYAEIPGTYYPLFNANFILSSGTVATVLPHNTSPGGGDVLCGDMVCATTIGDGGVWTVSLEAPI